MYYGGIDAHEAYLMIAVVDQTAERVLAPTRISVRKPERLREVLRPFQPLRVVVETCPFWPWIHDFLSPEGIGFVLAHAKRLHPDGAVPRTPS